MSIAELLEKQKELHFKAGLYHFTQVSMAYNSNKIEGSQLTEEEIRHIYENNTVTILDDKQEIHIDDIIETINHFRMFDYMLSVCNQPLTEEIIKEFHHLLKRGTYDEGLEWFNVGEYKSMDNQIGDVVTASPEDVPRVMQELLAEYGKISNPTFEDIVTLHVKFERIHPFQDGNGRVGRMMIFKECLKNDIMPFINHDANKKYYYQGLQEFDKHREYLFDTCLAAQEEYAKIVERFSKYDETESAFEDDFDDVFEYDEEFVWEEENIYDD